MLHSKRAYHYQRECSVSSCSLGETTDLLRMLGDAGCRPEKLAGILFVMLWQRPRRESLKTRFLMSPLRSSLCPLFFASSNTQNMPRKSKTAFSGSEKDEAMVLMHDVGMVARIRRETRGFKIVLGGGSLQAL
ncbi:MAG: hypothetical protein CM1200mP39_02070 [Dehalococcoidia bacterium]|nr:MAG: hypothetical protein CM1200mP39_02070 [Dehalococcoidia bacterium]